MTDNKINKDMKRLGEIVDGALRRNHLVASIADYEEGKPKPPVLVENILMPAEIREIREIRDKYTKQEGVTYEEYMEAYYVTEELEKNGALFIDFPGTKYENGLGFDELPPHTHQGGRIVINISNADAKFCVVNNFGQYVEYEFRPGHVAAFTGNPHTFTTKENLETLSFHLPLYDIEKDERAIKPYPGAFGA